MVATASRSRPIMSQEQLSNAEPDSSQMRGQSATLGSQDEDEGGRRQGGGAEDRWKKEREVAMSERWQSRSNRILHEEASSGEDEGVA